MKNKTKQSKVTKVTKVVQKEGKTLPKERPVNMIPPLENVVNGR